MKIIIYWNPGGPNGGAEEFENREEAINALEDKNYRMADNYEDYGTDGWEGNEYDPQIYYIDREGEKTWDSTWLSPEKIQKYLEIEKEKLKNVE